MVPLEDVFISKIVFEYVSFSCTVAFSIGSPLAFWTLTLIVYFLKKVPLSENQVKFHTSERIFIVVPL